MNKEFAIKYIFIHHLLSDVTLIIDSLCDR